MTVLIRPNLPHITGGDVTNLEVRDFRRSSLFAGNLNQSIMDNNVIIEKTTFGAGCFWCVEAVFERLKGVIDVQVGYTGGKTENPTYDEVCSGRTGHAEVIQIDFDSSKVDYEELLDLFWVSHDPTTLNQQGADVGTQYRSAIYYHSDSQKVMAEKSIDNAINIKLYPNRIVTEISVLDTFYIAEDYHQNYYRLNKNAPYCQLVIRPKLDKLNISK